MEQGGPFLKFCLKVLLPTIFLKQFVMLICIILSYFNIRQNVEKNEKGKKTKYNVAGHLEVKFGQISQFSSCCAELRFLGD